MTWNYRIILHNNYPDRMRHWLGLHEVYYDVDGKPSSWTKHAITFTTEAAAGKEALIAALELAINTLRDPQWSDVLLLSDLENE